MAVHEAWYMTINNFSYTRVFGIFIDKSGVEQYPKPYLIVLIFTRCIKLHRIGVRSDKAFISIYFPVTDFRACTHSACLWFNLTCIKWRCLLISLSLPVSSVTLLRLYIETKNGCTLKISFVDIVNNIYEVDMYIECILNVWIFT